MNFVIPAPLKAEHEALHDELRQAIDAGGKVGEAAKAVAQTLHPHFLKEEEYALPPLGMLRALAQSGVSPEMAEVLPLTDKLKNDLPHMLDEHKAVVAALERLANVARAENKPGIAHFTQTLIQHALVEEQVMYPAAIVAGEYVKLKLGK